MRRYDIVSGILLILSIIDFALAAPVLVQEKRQAIIDVVSIVPRDVINVLGKRGPGGEELEKLAKEYFVLESPNVHASSSSAPPRPDHGSTNVVQTPAPNLASSTANPIPLMESSSPSSTASSTLSESDFELSVLYELDELPVPVTGEHAPQQNPKKRPLTDPDPDFDWNYWMNLEDPPPLRPVKLPKESGKDNEYQVEYVQQPDPEPSTDSDFGWNHYPVPVSAMHAPPTSAGLPTEPEHEVVTPPIPGSKKEPEYDVFHGPRPSPGSADPELPSDHQSLGTDSQPVDLRAAIYAAKGKAKVSRRISGTTRDVGNAAQR
jgi:hypothetical protein